MGETKPLSLVKAFWLYGILHLSVLYITSLIVLILPIGSYVLSLFLPGETLISLYHGSLYLSFLYLKTLLVVTICLYGVYRVIRLIKKAGRTFGGNKLWFKGAIAVIVLATSTLLIITPIALIIMIQGLGD